MFSMKGMCLLMGFFCPCVIPDGESSSCRKKCPRRCRFLQSHHLRWWDRKTAPSSGSWLGFFIGFNVHIVKQCRINTGWYRNTGFVMVEMRAQTRTHTWIQRRSSRQLYINTDTFLHSPYRSLWQNMWSIYVKIFIATLGRPHLKGGPAVDVSPKEPLTLFTTHLSL